MARYLTPQEFAHRLANCPDDMLEYDEVPPGWEGRTFYRHGVEVAVLIVCGSEVHLSVKKEFQRRVLSRALFREMLCPVLERQGYVTTKLVHADQEARTFVERVGFRWTWADSTFNYFVLTQPPFSKVKQ